MSTAAIQVDTTNERLRAVTCTSWCEEGSGHTDSWDPEDQWCHGSQRIVRLTRMPLKHFERQHWLDNLRGSLRREREGQPYVTLNRDESPGVEMTFAEARELRDYLTELLALGEDGDAG